MKDFVFYFCFLLLMLCGKDKVSGQTVNADENQQEMQPDSRPSVEQRNWKTFSFKFLGTYNIGRQASMPCWPENTSYGYAYGGAPVNGFGFGLEVDFRPLREISFFFDVTAHSWKFQVAQKGSRSEGDWVFEQTDYTTRYTGVFDEDVYFFMNASLARMGVKLILPINNKTDAWFGIGYGFCTWTGNFLTADKKGTYGYDTGNGFSLSYLGGIDFKTSDDKSGMTVTVFIDAGSPLARPIAINNLFYDGWNWVSSAGEHAILPYRFGLALGF